MTPQRPAFDGSDWIADLLGLPVDEARARVRARGIESRCVFTAPPWLGEGAGTVRVVRVRQTDPEALELTTAWESFARASSKSPRRPAF